MNLFSVRFVSPIGKSLSVLAMAAAISFGTSTLVFAEIPVARFLQRLQEERLHGLAADYLEYLKQRNLLPEQYGKDFALAKLEIMQSELPFITAAQKQKLV